MSLQNGTDPYLDRRAVLMQLDISSSTLLTAAQVAEILGKSIDAVRMMAKRGQLPAVRVGERGVPVKRSARHSNYSMAMIDGEARRFGRCDLESEDRNLEPRPDTRGDIARTYVYMGAAYPGRGIISENNRKLCEACDREDPVDAWERERVRRLARLQGHPNPFVT